VVREWVARLPVWVQVTPVETLDDAAFRPLGAGERAAITLALTRHADLILIDECKGTHVALDKGFEVTGTLGILSLAARRGFVDLADSLARLKRTNFRYRQEIMDALLDQQARMNLRQSTSR
jgi:predicted nucleic acid-binding protein